MSKRQIVNIINFIRGIEPREDVDLITPVREQIKLMKELRLRGTFLIQYDALINPEYQELMKALDPAQFEIGVWYEIVQPMVEKAGIKWTGRFPWDWHTNCGFPVGYSKEQREMLVDILFEDFKGIFGYYPRVFGSWLYDAHTIRYISNKYEIDALCNCKEQYGTDGYTLWGGYYGQGYYPSKKNPLMPAQNECEQIPAPIFRMLGSDQVYQYDCGLSIDTNEQHSQNVITLEPVYTGIEGGGGVPAWVDWYTRENFNGECLSFGYTQCGQENSFGWSEMSEGLTYQFKLFAKMQSAGKIAVEPLGDTGRWFKKTYKSTPASTITAHNAFDNDKLSSVWYSSKKYRINFIENDTELKIRDLHVFDESYPDPFEDKVCETNDAAYETLPVVDGNRYSGNGVHAGMYLLDRKSGTLLTCDKLKFTDLGDGSAKLTYGSVEVELSESELKITAPKPFVLENRIGKDGGHLPTIVSQSANEIVLDYTGTEYKITLIKGFFKDSLHVESDQSGAIEAIIK